MRALNSDPATLFKAVWLAQLPTEARRVLAGSGNLDLDTLAKKADAIVESSRIYNSQDNMVAAVRTPAKVQAPEGICYYHERYGKVARKCNGSCRMRHLVVSPPVSGNDLAGR